MIEVVPEALVWGKWMGWKEASSTLLPAVEYPWTPDHPLHNGDSGQIR